MTERALPITILEPAGIDPDLLDHSLSLRFDLGQFDPRITFTRSSSATYFGSDGLLKTAAANEPRIDYDPVTGECKGFLVEESRTNLIVNSEATSTQSVTVAAATHALSFYGAGQIVLSGAYSAAVVGVGAFPSRTVLAFTPSVGTLTLTVSGDVGFAQLETGGFSTSWIPTGSVSATRAADNAVMMGTNFSSWYRQDEGTIFAEAETPNVVPSNRFPQVFYLSNGTTTDNMRIAYNTESLSSFGVRVGAVQQADLNRSVTGRLRKIAGSYAVDAFSMAANGGAVQTDSSGSLPTVTQSDIGCTLSRSESFLNGHIKRLAYYPKRLSNTQLQALTS